LYLFPFYSVYLKYFYVFIILEKIFSYLFFFAVLNRRRRGNRLRITSTVLLVISNAIINIFIEIDIKIIKNKIPKKYYNKKQAVNKI